MNMSENTKELVISGIKKVQDLASRELRSSERILIISGDREIIEEEDLRVSFLQSVENLSSILLPYYDQRMQKYYSENIVYLNGWFGEILNAVNDEYFKKVYEESPPTSTKGTINKTDVMLSLQIRKSKLLFNELMIFIQRNNILADNRNKSEVKDEF